MNQKEGENYPAKKRSSFHFLDRTTTSFFFTNVFDEVKTSVLWSLISRFGNVGEVLIPKKLSKRGRRLGFVNFKELEDQVALEERLDEVWYGGSCLKVNLARFNRDSQVVPTVSKSEIMVMVSSSLVDKGKSFEHVLGLVVGRENGGEEAVPELEVSPGEEALEQLEGCCVGYLHYPREADLVQTSFFMEDFKGVRMSSMGDNMVLLHCNMEGGMEAARCRKKEWWGS